MTVTRKFAFPAAGDIAPDDIVGGKIRSPHGWVDFTTTAYDVKGYVHAWVLDHPADDERFKFDFIEREVEVPQEIGAVIEGTFRDGNTRHTVRMMKVVRHYGIPAVWVTARPVIGEELTFIDDSGLVDFRPVDLAEVPF